MIQSTAGLIKAIHMGKRKLGMDNETYREMLRNLTGLDSCSQMTARELKYVLRHMRQAGFSPAPRETLSPQMQKCRALWLLLHEAGVVRDKSIRALKGYIRRMIHIDPDRATVHDMALVIESLKAWCGRTNVEYED